MKTVRGRKKCSVTKVKWLEEYFITVILKN